MHKPKAPRERKTIDWGDLLNRYSFTLVKLGGLAFIVCMGYFLYAIYGGGLEQTAPERAQYLIGVFGKGLVVSSVVLAAGFVLLTLDELAYAIIVGVGGVSLMLGVPYLVASNLANVSQTFQSITGRMSRSGTDAGMAVLCVVGIRVIYEVYTQIKDAPERRRLRMEKEAAEDIGALKKQKTIKAATVVSPCWDLPFCHERIREICPAFKAHRPCWRYGIGCNCDPKLIESLIRVGSTAKGPQTTERKHFEGAYIRADLQADVATSTKAERTIPCGKCPIYTEHQRLKFKFVNPIAIVGTFVLMGVMYVPITQAWDIVAKMVVAVAANVALGEVKATEWFGYLQSDAIRIFFFIFVCLMALSYVIRFTEWAVLVKKL